MSVQLDGRMTTGCRSSAAAAAAEAATEEAARNSNAYDTTVSTKSTVKPSLSLCTLSFIGTLLGLKTDKIVNNCVFIGQIKVTRDPFLRLCGRQVAGMNLTG